MQVWPALESVACRARPCEPAPFKVIKSDLHVPLERLNGWLVHAVNLPGHLASLRPAALLGHVLEVRLFKPLRGMYVSRRADYPFVDGTGPAKAFAVAAFQFCKPATVLQDRSE